MLNFLSLFLGPVFAKEMVEMARRKRYFFNRVLYGLVLFFALWIVWENHHFQIQSGKVTLRVMANLAATMFQAVSIVQYGAVFLFVPLFLCGVIAGEREERTLDLLFTTQLRDREIILGKLASRTVALVTLILCALPVMSIIMLFGGVDPDSLLRTQSATLLAMLFAGAHAIYFSAITKSPMGALVRTYWWMAVYLLGIPAITGMILSGTRSSPPAEMFCLAALFMMNPIGPFAAALEVFTYNQMASYAGQWFYPLAFIIPVCLSLTLLWRAVVRLRLPPSPFALFLKRLSLVRAVRGGFARVTGAIAVPFRALQTPARWIRNPFWLRARQARVYDREGYIGRIQWLSWFAAAVFLGLILAFHHRELSRDDTCIPFLVIAWLIVIMLMVILAGTSLVGERRRGFLDLVLMSPLSPREIIDGTLLAVWQHVRRSYSLVLVLALLFALTEAATPGALLCSLLTATLFCALTGLYGVLFSLPAKTIPGALVPTFVFPVLMNLGVVFLMPTFREASGPALWIMSALAFIGASLWVRRRVSVASVSAFLIAMHLAVTSVAVCWTWRNNNQWEYPIAAAHAGHLAFAPLGSRGLGKWFYGIDNEALMLVCYWIAVIVNFAWARGWAIRNFERLVERTDVVLNGHQPLADQVSRQKHRRPRPVPIELASARQTPEQLD